MLKEVTYYDVIMGNHSESFISAFDLAWKSCLACMDQKYTQSVQMSVGHRLRPLLAAWGYSLSSPSINNLDFNKVTNTAVSIELVHKASIITDDLIDNDNARHGKPTFHVEYSRYEAILFVVHLLGHSVKILNDNFSLNTNVTPHLNIYIDILSKTICEMSKGALKELNLSSDEITKLNELSEIINLETVSLIKNSFLLGYLSSGNFDKQVMEIVEVIGSKCGFVFQMLNDTEPFSQKSRNENYKGNNNFDFNKSRKNIVIGYLYGMSSSKEQAMIRNTKALKSDYILNLYNKYDITSFVLKEVSRIKSDIMKDVEHLLSLTNNKLWSIEFEKFIEYIFEFCIERVLK
ncbi:polyprenyl synthetase family protein [Paenibacillus sp. HW567]|uniref:polyprenyl synthetase family protein n=1 Tax=Paenibacillus sp. HW567 TaxID=1034769 RepID=UPI000368A3A8|nr:polyprenyl synthetase family protein [Paenibacillus sp. HW567]